MTSIYFPSRTNVHYWDLETLELDLSSRLKLSAIVYDELILDDGVYTALIGPNLSVEIVTPLAKEQLPAGYLDSLPKEGGEFSLTFNDLGLSSPAQRRYQVSFRALFEEAGLPNCSWINFNQQKLNEEIVNTIKQKAQEDLNIFHDGGVETYLLHLHIIQSVIHDWIFGSIHGWDLNLDPMHETYLRQKLFLLNEQVDALNPPVDFDIVFPHLPDLSLVPWEQIIETREHPSAIAFRKNLADISHEARQKYLAGESADAVRFQVMKWRDEQLIKEIENRLLTRKGLVVENTITLGFLIGGSIPGIGAFVGLLDTARSIAGSVADYSKDQYSTAAAFVRKSKKR